jgi:predicted ester cyclase
MSSSPGMAPATDAAAFINEYFRVWQGTDEERILSYYTDDVRLSIPGTMMNGRAAVRDQFVRPFIAGFPGNLHIAKNMIFGPNVVVVEWSFEAEHKGPFAGRAATGARVQVPGCSVYEYDLAKRQITGGRIYFDIGTLLRQIGAM